jgi:hypothetical protein
VRVELTAAGEEAYQRMLAAVIAFNRRLQAGIGRDELEGLDGLLDRLAENWLRVCLVASFAIGWTLISIPRAKEPREEGA